MNRKEYLELLRTSLQHLPLDELKDILSDYEEHFDIGISKGKSEEEISSELGHPKEVASNYKTSYKPSFNNSCNTNINDNTRKTLIILGLVFFNLVVVFGPFMGLVGLFIGLYASSIAFVITGILLVFSSPFLLASNFMYFSPLPTPHMLTSISFGIAIGGLGLLGIILAVYLTKLFYNLLIKYIKWNIQLFNK